MKSPKADATSFDNLAYAQRYVVMEKSSTRCVWDVDWKETQEIYRDIGVQELDPDKPEKQTKRILRKSQKRKQEFQTPENQQEQPTKKSLSSTKNGCKCQLFKTYPENVVTDKFETLSDEIMLCILKWLPRRQLAKCARISKRWKQLCQDESLWKRIDLSECKFSSETLGPVLLRTLFAAKLARCTIKGPLFEPKFDAENYCPEFMIEYLDLSMCNADSELVGDIVGRCPYLVKLSLESCEVTEDMLASISLQRSLEELNLCMAQNISGKMLIMAMEMSERLKSLNLAWLNLSRNVISSLVKVLPQTLERLNLSGCRESLQDADVENLSARCPNLVELDLSDGCALTGNIFVYLESIRNLQHLALSRCYRIPNPLLLMDHLKQLRSLKAVELFGLITEHDLNTLCKGLAPVRINTHPFSSISRPTMSVSKRSYVWEVNCRV
ncbi:S-phase kinase-associated protein 2 [Holothuria leucospilota]|uniref:S-phase kinase-associated protein 2 n=1 Tax=Holothuria leucospilota TaxID=206669 RepID=A0A9Q1C8T8_HOLLE|nr:S-phase kinase-associated protein 2 [Holothuria leucospilota]